MLDENLLFSKALGPHYVAHIHNKWTIGISPRETMLLSYVMDIIIAVQLPENLYRIPDVICNHFTLKCFYRHY